MISLTTARNNQTMQKPNFLYQYWELLSAGPKTTKALCLDCGNAVHEVMHVIIRAIQLNTYLEDLTLDGWCIANDIALDLASAASARDTTIRKLRLRWLKLAGTAATVLFRALKDNKGVQELYLEGNDLDVHDAVALATAIRENETLRVLHIKTNPIGAEGVHHIADAMQFNRTIQELCLQQNTLRSHVSEYLGAMLVVNRTLKVFHMVHNRMETPDVMALFKYMEYNDTLQHFIILWGNSIGPEGALTIIRGLEHNHSLLELRIVANDVGSEAARAMADVLMTNKSLTTLDFGSNRIADEGGKALVVALKVNVTCRSFVIQDNPMSNIVKSEISYFVSLNNAGRQLLRGYNVPKGLWAFVLSRSNQQERQ
jgi:hypothetical protein